MENFGDERVEGQLGHRNAAIEGRVAIRLDVSGDAVARAEVSSTRPLGAAAVLEGRPALEAVRALPLLYSLCGTAHTVAGLAAAEGALGIEPDAAAGPARRVLVAGEALGQLLWRLFLDLPQEIEEETGFQPLRDARARLKRLPKFVYPRANWICFGGAGAAPRSDKLGELAGTLSDITRLGLYGPDTSAAQVLGDPDQFAIWVARGATPTARVFRYVADTGLAGFGATYTAALGEDAAGAVATRLHGDDARTFIAAPEIDGEARETGAFARFAGHPLVAALVADHGPGLLARLAAKLVAVEALVAEIRAGGMSAPNEPGLSASTTGLALAGSGNGSGAAVVETSRGLLFHAVTLHGETTARYRILAPTEWNFHREGPLAEGLTGTPVGDRQRFRTAVGLFAATVDPCVQSDVTFEDISVEV